MAQLNPNFEIDFNDINSYEQIQLIKDTQLAKENLLMHKAYKEPAEDEIIRNQFSSFTFVDFCPKLFTTSTTTGGVGGAGTTGSLSRSNSRPSSSARMANTNIQEYGERLDYERDHHGQAPASSLPRGSKSLRQHNYELETFSDLFDRINLWLKLNKDWRVVSMETLIFDCTSQFNHLKSSIQSSYLPKNMRSLRLYLSPSKSRFSGPQKIGCINVIPRKISGRYRSAGGGSAFNGDEQLQYENLDQILARLNELLLTRPIEGRILSVETITLPIVDGYVNTETNYFMDNRLNLLNERIYTHANTFGTSAAAATTTAATPGAAKAAAGTGTQVTGERAANGADGMEETAAGLGHEPIVVQPGMCGTNRLCDSGHSSHGLIDILRVYYEFGSMVCGLVNLIDFVPRLHRHRNQQQQQQQQARREEPDVAADSDHPDRAGSAMDEQQQAAAAATAANSTGIESSESLTRLVKRSLAWFELERKRILHETSRRARSAAGEGKSDDEGDDDDDDDDDDDEDDDDDDSEGQDASGGSGRVAKWPHQHRQVDLKVCNLQVHHKIMLKGQLARVSPQNVFETIRTRQMFHEPPREPIMCQQCQLSSATHPMQEWCQHLLALDQAYELKFVRLAYVVPVYNKYAASRLMSICAPQPGPRPAARSRPTTTSTSPDSKLDSETAADAGSSSPIGQPVGDEAEVDLDDNDDDSECEDDEHDREEEDEEGAEEGDEEGDDDGLVAMEDALVEARDAAEKLAKEASLEIVQSTNERQRASELAHQLGSGEDDEQSSLIGQLTYRLFAPCQLVNSSSCFSINPVNSSSPLSRRGSVQLNGSAPGTSLSSENAIPSTLLLPTGGASLSNLSESMTSINQQHQAHAGGPLLSSPSSQQLHHHQQTISFGALFPTLSHDIIHGGAPFGKQAATSHLPGSAGAHFTTNEFEPVEAIKRRMEIYVTTNSMKVLAGETLVVNLSDQLSCLSTAISETIVKASFSATRPASTWVSVYILYAAVDEPHLPSQLLERQRIRERLTLISEEEQEPEPSPSGTGTPSRKVSRSDLRAGPGSAGVAPASVAGETNKNPAGQDNMVPVFDDDFCTQDQGQSSPATAPRKESRAEGAAAASSNPLGVASDRTQPDGKLPPVPLALRNQADGSIRVELERDSSASLYNSAYDRTVALPSQPDNQLSDYLEPVDFNLNPQQLAADGLWFDDENDLNAASQVPWSHHHQQHGLISLTSVSVRAAQRQMRLRQSGATKSKAAFEKRKSKKKNSAKKLGSSGGHSEDSQCSVM